jgi:hypothetical protein
MTNPIAQGFLSILVPPFKGLLPIFTAKVTFNFCEYLRLQYLWASLQGHTSAPLAHRRLVTPPYILGKSISICSLQGLHSCPVARVNMGGLFSVNGTEVDLYIRWNCPSKNVNKTPTEKFPLGRWIPSLPWNLALDSQHLFSLHSLLMSWSFSFYGHFSNHN